MFSRLGKKMSEMLLSTLSLNLDSLRERNISDQASVSRDQIKSMGRMAVVNLKAKLLECLCLNK